MPPFGRALRALRAIRRAGFNSHSNGTNFSIEPLSEAGLSKARVSKIPVAEPCDPARV